MADAVRDARPDADAGGTVLGVAGHSHDVRDATVGGLRLLNPGSATGARPASEATLLVLDVEGSRVDVTERGG